MIKYDIINQDLERLATRSQVSGYWLNIPGQGTACPKCGTPQPQVAIDFLQRLSS